MLVYAMWLIFVFLCGLFCFSVYHLALETEIEKIKKRIRKKIIFHVTNRNKWDAAREHGQGYYGGDELKEDGFIHCSNSDQVIEVAEGFKFRKERELVLLEIHMAKLEYLVKYESAFNVIFYPHIYGPINLSAVLKAHVFEPNENGHFSLPEFPSVKVEPDPESKKALKIVFSTIFMLCVCFALIMCFIF